MNRIFTILGLVTCLSGVPVPSDADQVEWPLSGKTYTNGGSVNGTLLVSSDQANVRAFSSDAEACIEQFFLCIPGNSVDAVLLLTDQTTLIGHLTLDEYASLAEIAAVTDMYLTEDALTVRFFGGAWPGSVLSVFETSFVL